MEDIQTLSQRLSDRFDTGTLVWSVNVAIPPHRQNEFHDFITKMSQSSNFGFDYTVDAVITDANGDEMLDVHITAEI